METAMTGPDLRKAYCYYIDPIQTPHPQHGYTPSIVVEGDPGHYPLTGRGEHATPWYWGNLDMAEKIAAEQNLRLGVDEREALRIIGSSMAASR
jgi:hypothetical protein